jgi:hypothetical protein
MAMAIADGPGMDNYVALHSWHDGGSHPALLALIGRTLRVTVEVIDNCPRCGLPLDTDPGASRADGDTRICSSCEIEETLLVRDGQLLQLPEEWPLSERYTAALDTPPPDGD